MHLRSVCVGKISLWCVFSSCHLWSFHRVWKEHRSWVKRRRHFFDTSISKISETLKINLFHLICHCISTRTSCLENVKCLPMRIRSHENIRNETFLITILNLHYNAELILFMMLFFKLSYVSLHWQQNILLGLLQFDKELSWIKSQRADSRNYHVFDICTWCTIVLLYVRHVCQYFTMLWPWNRGGPL